MQRSDSGAPAREGAACPCLHTEPCDPNCTCVKPWMSIGCRRCCSYGSPAQQKAQAEWLAALEARLAQAELERDAARAALRDLLAHVEAGNPSWRYDRRTRGYLAAPVVEQARAALRADGA